MRICHVNLSRGFRGGERQTLYIVQESIKKYGIENVLVICSSRGQLFQKLSSLCGLNIVCAGIQLIGHFEANAFKPHCCHAHEARAVQWVWIHLMLFGVPYVITRRVEHPLKDKLLTRLTYGSAAKVVSISKVIQADISRLGIDSLVIPSAVPFERNDQIDLESRGKTILVAGALVDHHKGQTVAIRALSRLGPEWKLTIVGDGPDRTVFKKLIKELNLQDNATLEIWSDEFLDFAFLSHEYFVMPSRHEGLGSILLDAMGKGCVIVASNVGGIPDLVKPSRTGVLFEVGNDEQLAEMLLDLDARPEHRVHLKKEAIDFASNSTPMKMMEAHHEIYRETQNNEDQLRG